ncbi:hypothetical protein TSUD_55180 [Trifolium subterraneum]|uniref:Uncharacterized protein n=1 Tax=Trifolium subterraneum TaxID=3900 RepID=A0A2Z6MUE1_TRISU|nr:hypothetical protein TSUD_55180 [Trifolium subterraneum]
MRLGVTANLRGGFRSPASIEFGRGGPIVGAADMGGVNSGDWACVSHRRRRASRQDWQGKDRFRHGKDFDGQIDRFIHDRRHYDSVSEGYHGGRRWASLLSIRSRQRSLSPRARLHSHRRDRSQVRRQDHRYAYTSLGNIRKDELERVKGEAIHSEGVREREVVITVGEVDCPERKEEREKGKGEGKSEEWKYLPLVEDVKWATICSSAKLKNGLCLYVVQQALQDAGLSDTRLVPMGGDRVLLYPRFDREGIDIHQVASEVIGNFLVDCKPWSANDEVVYERGAWVRCYGVPVHAWNNIFFAELAESQGRLLQVDDCTLKKERMDYARLLIATTVLKEINGMVLVVIDNKDFCIRIIEDIEFGYATDACLVEYADDNNFECSAHSGGKY